VALGTTVNASTTDTDGSILLNTTATAAATSTDLTDAIKTALGGGTAAASITGNKVTITGKTGSADSITLGGSALSKIGLVAGTTAATSSKAGQTLTIGAIDGSKPQTIKLGGTGGVKTLDELNTKLADSNLQASIDDKTGKLTITTTNDEASFDFTKNSSLFTSTSTPSAFTATTGLFGAAFAVTGPVADVNAQNTRSNLVAQYNTVIDQIKTTAADSSFNGVNLLNGDTLALTFNETGKSKLSISGVTFDPSGLGLASLTKNTDFLDNAATNKILTNLTDASSKLRSQASAFGSNLSVVQMRQDFSKSLINVLQTGASNLTLADTNEEAANSQALSTRQSIAVSALSLANTAQQGVLQLLR